jgi:two-component system, NtrC family, sensor kinase
VEYLAFLVISPIAASVLLLTISTAWSYREVAAGRSLLYYLVLITCLLGGNIAELLAQTPSGTLFWAKIDHIYFSLIPVAWISFAFQYAGLSQHVGYRRIRFAFIIPVVTNILVQTNHLHGLFWRRLDLLNVRGFLTMKGSYGPWFWVNGAYIYALLILGAIVIIRSYVNSRRLYSKQSIWVASGALIPIIFNAIYVFRLFPFLRMDFSSLVFALSGFAFFIGIHRFRLLRVVPIARNTIIDDLESAVVVLDASGNILDFNHAAESLATIDDAAIGTPISHIPELNVLIDDIALDEPAKYRTKLTGETPVRHVEIQIRPVGPERANAIGTILTISDVSDWVRLIDEKKITLERLEEKTHTLQEMQDQLIQREKLAAIGKLAASVAHEINNPLSYLKSTNTALVSYADKFVASISNRGSATIDDIDAHEVERIIEDVRVIKEDTRDGIDRIIEVAHNLLNYARPDRKQSWVRYDLNNGIRRALNLAKTEYQHIVEIELSLGETPEIECLPGEINQVLLNIFTNAVQAIRLALPQSGKGKISISTRCEAGAVVCEITDDGPAIEQDDLDRIFDPFYSTKPEQEGTGLGLSIAREIVVTRHHGLVDVETGETTTFRITLPVDQS